MRTYLRLTAIYSMGMFLLAANGCKKKEGDAVPAAPTAAEENIKLTDIQLAASQVEVIPVRIQPFKVEIEALGEVASDTDRTTPIRSSQPGTVKEILVSVGDAVAAGQVLLRYQAEGTSETQEELKASQPGIVVGVYAEPEGHMDPAVPQLTLADISRLRVGLNVYEKDIPQVHKGQRVSLKMAALPKDTFEGAVTYISPRVDEESRTIKVRADVHNTGGKLKFGMFITGHIVVSQRETLAIPEAAVQTIKGKTTVFMALDKNTFQPREIELGERSDDLLEVKSGLKSGDRIVSKGSFILKSELSKGELGEGE